MMLMFTLLLLVGFCWLLWLALALAGLVWFAVAV
jgi:hypothetical protein